MRRTGRISPRRCCGRARPIGASSAIASARTDLPAPRSEGTLARCFARKPIDDQDLGLRRSLGAASLVALGVGAIVGAGLFSLTGIAAADYAGPAVILSFVVAAIGCAFTGLCYSEMAGLLPSAGSAYAYAYAALGEAVAWMIGWDLLLEYSVGAATVAVSWSSYVRSLLDGWGIALPHAYGADVPAMAVIVLLSLVLIGGISESATLNAVITALKLGVVAVVVSLGAFYVKAANYTPFIPPNAGHFGAYGWSGVLRGAAVVFFAYLGFDAVSTAAAEAKRPQRTIPIGILGSLALCTVLYLAFATVLVGMVNYTKMHNDASPVATAMAQTPFAWLQAVVKIGVILGFTSVMLVGLLGQGRIMLAMARDGMLPSVFGRIHATRKTPWVAHASLMGGTALLAGFVPVEALSKMTSAGTLLAFAVVAGCVLALRRREPRRERPFRVPGGVVIPVLGIATCAAMLLSLPWQTWLRLVGWFALGVVVYGSYSHRRAAAVRAR